MARTPSMMTQLGGDAPDFCLPDTEDGQVKRTDFSGQPLLVMFICNHCPFVVHLADALASFAKIYMPRGIAIVAINSNDVVNYPDDSPEKMKEEKAAVGYPFPYLFDETQEVARAYSAACTPDFFLYDAAHTLVYRGQFDGSRPGNDVPVTGADLRSACDAVLNDRAVDEPQRPSLGCNIKWKPGQAP